jgi:hypothetical protein
MPVGHACNTSQEDHGSKPAWTKAHFVRPYLKKSFTKKAGGVAQHVDREFKTQHHKKK